MPTAVERRHSKRKGLAEGSLLDACNAAPRPSITPVPAGQEPSISRQRIQGTEEAQAVYEVTDEGIDGDHAFGFELAEGNMNSPVARTGRAQAVIRQVGALADTHAGVAEQQEDITDQVVAAEELLL